MEKNEIEKVADYHDMTVEEVLDRLVLLGCQIDEVKEGKG